MKKLLLALGILGFSATTFAQDKVAGQAMSKVRQSRDFLVIGFSYDGWASAPDAVRTKGLSRGFNIALMYDIPIAKEHFSVAPGIGFTTSSIFLDKQVINMSNGNSNQVEFVNSDTYKKYKVATTTWKSPWNSATARIQRMPTPVSKPPSASVQACW